MTRIVGQHLITAPCCRAIYAAPTYASINYMAYEYWSDGMRLHSLWPMDKGLRRCKCGSLFLMHEADHLEVEADESIARAPGIDDEELIAILETETVSETIEVAVRTRLWWHLNDQYRDKYRDVKEQLDRANQHTWIEKQAVRFRLAKARQPMEFIVPPYAPTELQTSNMGRLLEMLLATEKPSGVVVAELHREQGNYADVPGALAAEESNTLTFVIETYASQQCNAPLRFRW